MFCFVNLSWKMLIMYTQENVMSPLVALVIQLQQLLLLEDFEQRSRKTGGDLPWTGSLRPWGSGAGTRNVRSKNSADRS